MESDESLLKELKQRRPFRTSAQEAWVAILRTADVLRRVRSTEFEAVGLTEQQYNVLRILRGAHPDTLPTLEIGSRMIERQPGITRLLDRLEAKGWVRRERSTSDRRIVDCSITDAGLDLLGRVDGPAQDAEERILGVLSATEQRQLTSLLRRVRAGAED